MRDLRSRYHSARTVCFEQLVAGGYFDIFNSVDHAGKEPLLALYRHRVLRYHRLAWPSPAASISQHRVLLVHKQGRRGIHNFAEVLAYLRRACDGHCIGLGDRGIVSPVSFRSMDVTLPLARTGRMLMFSQARNALQLSIQRKLVLLRPQGFHPTPPLSAPPRPHRFRLRCGNSLTWSPRRPSLYRLLEASL